MKRIVRLTENDLARIVRRVINENTGEFPIPKEGFFSGLKSEEVTGSDGSTYNPGAMTLKTKEGGKMRLLKPGVVEFDAVLIYEKWYGGNNKGKAFPVKGYYGCNSGLFTAADTSNNNKVVKFERTSMGMIQTAYFTDETVSTGLCKAK